MDRLSIEQTGTFEFALWCKLLRDRGYTGMQVARVLGKSEGYVNNLVRILERASLKILERWCAEQRPNAATLHVCATDWLMHVCILPHAEQDVLLAERVAKLTRAPTNTNAAAVAPDPDTPAVTPAPNGVSADNAE
ncbi:MAG TPA: hypothetical protein VMZ53_04910 [Kofleriaceae bacterium]|nr:hypothetical protein [Kofleriaceae bacterium]